jgi:hypothetical protein
VTDASLLLQSRGVGKTRPNGKAWPPLEGGVNDFPTSLSSLRRCSAKQPIHNRAIAVLNLAMGKPTASWPVGYDSNFPMALDGNAKQLS